MSWKDILQSSDESTVLPWISGRSLRSLDRSWRIEGKLPQEPGWYEFSISVRTAKLKGASDPKPEIIKHQRNGYLVGDRFITDTANVDPNPANIALLSEPVYLLDDGLDRFTRVVCGLVYSDGPLFYERQAMPLGPEDEVLTAFLDEKISVSHIKGVTPALDAAFRMERWQKVEAEKRRRELERLRREEEEKRILLERRQQLAEQLGDGAGRRAMAHVDFAEAARAALAVGGAQFLDHRRAVRRGEVVVRYKVDARRYECVCDERTMRIIDSGICLTAHYDDEDFEVGTKGDNFFTLESLPSVIREAVRDGKLVVYRHVD